MFQDARWQGIVLGQFLQHFFIGTACTCGGFFNDWQTQLVKKDFPQLFGAAQVERLSSDFVGFRFELYDALTQSLALRRQRGAIDQHTIALNAKQSFAGGNFNVVDGA